jgi:hypothetical protein
MMAALVGAGCCLLLVPLAAAAGVWTTLATLGRAPSPDGLSLGLGTVGLPFAAGAGLVVLALSVAVLEELRDRLAG